MAGYSTKPLPQKLGIKAGFKVSFLNQPEDYGHLLFPFPDNCSIFDTLAEDSDFIQFFTENKKDLETVFPRLKKSLKKDGALWISWPKKSSKKSRRPELVSVSHGMPKPVRHDTDDLNENIIREVGLKNGLVDVKVAAIDEKWSGLKFVYRLEDR